MRKLICGYLLHSILIASFFLPVTPVKSQSSTKKQIERIQKQCYDQLSDEERNVLFPSKKKRRMLMEQVVNKLSRGKKFMSKTEVKKLMDDLEKMKEISPYQDLSSYWIVNNVLKDALPICKDLKICEPSFNPRFATLYCSDVNADARKVNNEFVLFVNGKLITFCYQMMKSIVESIRMDVKDTSLMISYSKADIIRKMRKDTLLQGRFIGQLRYAFSGKKYKDYIQPLDYDPFVGELTHSMELFIISHELYHASKNHDLKNLYKFSNNETYNSADSLLKKKIIATGWSYEILADYHGQYMLNLYSGTIERDYFSDMAKLAGLLYLKFDHVYRKAEYIFRNGEKQKTYSSKDIDQIGKIVSSFTAKNPSDSLLQSIEWNWTSQDHPPYELRSQIIAGMIEDVMSRRGEKSNESAEAGFFILGKNLISAIEILYNICEPELLKIAKQTNLKK